MKEITIIIMCSLIILMILGINIEMNEQDKYIEHLESKVKEYEKAEVESIDSFNEGRLYYDTSCYTLSFYNTKELDTIIKIHNKYKELITAYDTHNIVMYEKK